MERGRARSGGRRRGRGRGGRGGRGGGIGAGNEAGQVRQHSEDDKAAIQERKRRKARRREDQLAAEAKKAEGETQYYWNCVREVRLKAQRQSNASQHQKRRIDKVEDVFGPQASAGIDFDKYTDLVVECSDPDVKPLDSFAASDSLGDPLKRSIAKMGYVHPTPIQRYAVPAATKGSDVMACAQTGSGKTCGFLLPIVSSLLRDDLPHLVDNEGACAPVALVLAPTRELASQIDVEAGKLLYWTSIEHACIYGGAPARAQLQQLARSVASPLILTATPGRLIDFIDRSIISLAKVRYLVLDEADRMLDMGFEPQIRRLLSLGMPPREQRRTLMFSATFPREIQELASTFLRPGYTWISIGRVGSTTASITQQLIQCSSDKWVKMDILAQQLAEVEGRTLVFVRMKRTAHQVKELLQRDHNVAAVEIHGNRTQQQREAALDSFRSGQTRVLIATDVAARGLDIPDVTHVINFDLPLNAADFDSYVHRIGRTGRAGNRGLATSFYVPGLDPKHGNGPIAPQLIALLQESNQELPVWFLELPEVQRTMQSRQVPQQERRSHPQHVQRDHRSRRVRGPSVRRGI